MASTFISIEMGNKALYTEQMALKTAGHNIANANTEGYTRQRVDRTSEIPLYDPSLNRDQRPGMIGQGVQTTKIERLRDAFIDDRIMEEKGNQGYWKARNDYLIHLEMIHNEPDDKNIRSLMDSFWNSLEELSNNPSENAVREVVKERGRTLTSSINHTWNEFSEIQKNVNGTVKIRVDEINDMAESIRKLNVEIMKSENVGDTPNDLYDRRDLLVEKLSKMADVTVGRSNSNEFMVWIGSVHLIQGEHREYLKAVENPKNKGFYDVTWEDGVTLAKFSGGEMKSLIEIRDKDVDYQIRQLNTLAANMSDLTNEIHRDGFDLNFNTGLDFFKTLPITKNANGDYDLNNTGTPQVTALFKVAGGKTLDPKSEIGIAGQITLDSNTTGGQPILVNYVATDKVSDVIKKINDSQSEVVAYLTHNNQLALKSTVTADKNNMDFVLRHLEDSGDFLVNYSGILKQSGAAGAYDWKTAGQLAQLQVPARNLSVTPLYDPASWMSISDAVDRDTRSIAAARGTDYQGNGSPTLSNGVGDGGNALLLAGLRYQKTMIGSNDTFNDFYTAVVSKTGTLTEQADIQVKTSDKLMEQLTTLRSSLSGVNLDEEMANLIMFQQAYNAAAKFVSIQDRMLDTIIRMGL